jgi:hypothetical protein
VITEPRGLVAQRQRSRSCAFALLLLSISGYGTVPVSASAAPPQSAAQAKKDYALIYGTVWGPDERRVAGIPLKIRRASDKKAKWELISDSSGEFAQRVPVGTQDYVIQADVKVPKGQPKPEVTVHIDDNERKDVGLHLTQQQLPPK